MRVRLVPCIWLALVAGAGAQPWVEPPSSSDAERAVEQHRARQEVLAQEREAIARARQELDAMETALPDRIEALDAATVTEAMVEQARVDAESARLKKEEVEVQLAAAERAIATVKDEIEALEAREQLLKNPAAGQNGAGRPAQLEDTRQALQLQRSALELERAASEVLAARLEQFTRRVALTEQWLAVVESAFHAKRAIERRAAQEDLEERLQRVQQEHLAEAARLRQALEAEGAPIAASRRHLIETRIEAEEERAELAQLDARLGRVDNEVAADGWLVRAAEAPLGELRAGLERLAELEDDLSASSELLQRKLELWQQKEQVVRDRQREAAGRGQGDLQDEAGLVLEVLEALAERKERVDALSERIGKTLAALEATFKERQNAELLARRVLPEGAEAWRALFGEIAAAPRVMFHQVRLSAETAVRAMLQAPELRLTGLVAAEAFIIWLVVVAKRSLRRAIERVRTREGSFTMSFLMVGLRTVERNAAGVGVSVALLAALFIAQVPQPGLGIILTMVLLWIAIRGPITVAWLLLASSHLPERSRRPQLYRQLRWSLIIGAVVAATIIIARLSQLSEPVVAALDRAFMLYLLAIFVPVLRLRRFVVDLLAARYEGQVWFASLRLVTLLLPLSLLGASVLGLVGYLNLAWSVAWHLLVFIAVMVGWQMARGLLNDLVIWLKNCAVVRSGYGRLWTQEVVGPLHKILGMVLFLVACLILLQAYGWEGESTFVAAARELLQRPLFTLGGAEITLLGIGLTLFTIFFIVLLGQWMRAVTYRWVYSRVVDLGVRHSLSVFTQYAVVLVGFMVILRVVGVDLTTLTVFAGAVGVGIGFGMQAIANNFISGLLLLIERPLRSGDIVRIGTNDGTVTRIGIRSLTMQTFDNTEVIIPNSDVITSAFTNWTHTDRVIRTVFMVRIAYDADPPKVQRIIERVVTTHPAVVRDPEPLITLWEFTDSCMLFRVHYFTDVIQYHIIQVRSEILMSVWQDLQRAGVRVPFAQQDLYIKELPGAQPRAALEANPGAGVARDPLPEATRASTTPLFGI